MKIRLAAPLILAAMAMPASALFAQDVSVFSTKDADDVLSAPAADAAAPQDCGPDKKLLPNGECVATRIFTLARSGNKAAVASPQLVNRPPVAATTMSGNRKGKAATSRRPVARTGVSREVPMQFALGSFELSKQSKANLDTLAVALKSPKHIDKRVRISGHTDKSGTLETNQLLSQQRADAASDYLVTQGIARERIEAIGSADSVPLDGLSPFSAKQRRVEVTRIQ